MEDHYLTVKQLKKVLKGLPDDMPVFYQRIEDIYFKKHGWDKTVLEIPDEMGSKYPDEYTRAFTVWTDGKHLLITAHY